MALVSCRLEPVIWSHDTGHQIPCFDRCQLLITWMSNVKEVHSTPRLHVSGNLLWSGHHVVQFHCHAYAPTSNTTAHDNHEKINSWVSFSLYGYGAPLELHYEEICNDCLHGIVEMMVDFQSRDQKFKKFERLELELRGLV